LNSDQASGLERYAVAELDVPDNTADSSALIQVGQLRMRLMRESDVSDAYACLGTVRLVERRPDNEIILDKQYIPPSLRVNENGVLCGYTREIAGLLHQRGEELAAQVTQPGRGGVGEIADFLLLQTVNRYEPVFMHYTRASLLHPERLFMTCLQLAGDLSTFSRENRRVSTYPDYLHNNLEASFVPLVADLRRSLSMVLNRSAVPIDLQDRKFGVRVALISDQELLKGASFVLAVNAKISPEVLRARFPSQVKIGPVERIRDLVNLQLPGIPLRSMPVAPRQIPFHAGFNYFELERGGELWEQLERSGGMAMHIAGDFPGLELEFWGIKG
jgi:type VI secretion system protein ImpJ